MANMVWNKGENDEQLYWSCGVYDIIQLKEDMKQIFMVEWRGSRSEKGTPAYMGHYQTIEDAMSFENGRNWKN